MFSDRREIEPDKDAASIQVTLPAPVVNDSWPQSGGFANYAMQHLAIGNSPQVVLDGRRRLGFASSRILTTPPVVADGKVFAKDAESTVSAYTADTGQRIWSVTLKPEKARDTDEFGGGLAWYGGKLFVTTGFAEVFCLDPNTGTEVWTSMVSAPIRGAPLVFGDRVFTDVDRQQAACHGGGRRLGPVELLGPAGGRGLHRRQQPGGLGRYHRGARSPRASWSACALDNGRPVWNESLVGPRREARAFGNLADIRGRPVIDRGLVLAMGTAGTLTAIDLRSGQRQWERNIGGNQTPWVAGRFVFVVTGSADVAALERDTGKVKWVTPLSQYQDENRRKPMIWAGPVLASDRLLVGGSTGEMLSLSPYTGEIIGKLDMRRRCGWRPSSPIA